MNDKRFRCLLAAATVCVLSSCGGGDDGGDSGDQAPAIPINDVSARSIETVGGLINEGRDIAVSVEVENLGNVSAFDVNLQLYFSLDTVLDDSDALVGETQIPEIRRGRIHQAQLDVPLPSGLTLGVYHLIADANWPIDRDFSDNTKSSAVHKLIANATSTSLALDNKANSRFAFVPDGNQLLIKVVEERLGVEDVVVLNDAEDGRPVHLDFEIDSCAADNAAQKLVCIGEDSGRVAIFDLASFYASGLLADVVVSECALPVDSDDVNFVYAGCVNCGVVTDPGENRFIVSSADGYRVVNYGDSEERCEVSAFYNISPAQSFAFDPVRNWILANEREANAFFTGKDNLSIEHHGRLRLVDLNQESIHVWEQTLGCTLENSVSGSPLCDWRRTEAALFDASSGTGLFLNSLDERVVAIDFSQIELLADERFSAPYVLLPLSRVLDGVSAGAIYSGEGVAFLAEEFGRNIIVVALADTANDETDFSAHASWEYISAEIPVSATCGGWSTASGAGGVSIYAGLENETPLGVLVNHDKSCLAIIDLKRLLDAPKQLGQNFIDRTVDIVDEGILTFIQL